MSQQCSWPTHSWPLEGRCPYYALLGLTQAPGFAGGHDLYSETVLARMIQQAEEEVQQAKNGYAALLKNDSGRSTVQQIRKYYDEFLGWANEFDLASVSRKRSILAQLFEKTGLINLFIDNLQQMEKLPHWLFFL